MGQSVLLHHHAGGGPRWALRKAIVPRVSTIRLKAGKVFVSHEGLVSCHGTLGGLWVSSFWFYAEGIRLACSDTSRVPS